MRLAPRWFAVLATVVVTLVSLGATELAVQVESPAAGLSAKHGAPLPPPAQQSPPGVEHTRTFDVVTRLTSQGTVHVTETIVQDFGPIPRHGIERIIPLRDSLGEHRMRHLVVSTSTGTPDDVSISATTNAVRIRIGDAGHTISGAHAYQLAYELGGMTDRVDGDRSRLAIDALSEWRQPIDTLTYTVHAPGRPLSFRCEQGAIGVTDPCASATSIGDGATFVGNGLTFGSAFTVRMTWPDDVVAVSAAPSSLDAVDLVVALLVGLGVALVAWMHRRRWMALLAVAREHLWATFGPDAGGRQTDGYDLTGEPAIEFVPPMQLRPGELGALTEVGETRLLTATVVDLAARGAIKITESNGSWTLERRDGAVKTTDDERELLDGIFEGAEATSLAHRGTEMGELGGTLAERLTDDLEDRGLAVRGTRAGGIDTQPGQWWILVAGVVAALLGALVRGLVVDATGTRDLAPVLQLVTGLVVLFVVGAVAVRRAGHGVTPTGLAAAWRAHGFDRFFTDSEATHARAAADRGLLRQYMGYAIVFGHVDQWIAAFEAPDTSDWFATTSPLPRAFAGFTERSLWSAPRSSGSGFGGGGGGAGGGSGGGGGGSW